MSLSGLIKKKSHKSMCWHNGEGSHVTTVTSGRHDFKRITRHTSTSLRCSLITFLFKLHNTALNLNAQVDKHAIPRLYQGFEVDVKEMVKYLAQKAYSDLWR